jgi:hypothetical protein
LVLMLQPEQPRLGRRWASLLATLGAVAVALPVVAGADLRANPANKPRLLGAPIEDYLFFGL